MKCPDCGLPLHEEVQRFKHKPEPRITLTCLNRKCSLHGVTLTQEEWQSANLLAYQAINALMGART
jgi:hypothetical protein